VKSVTTSALCQMVGLSRQAYYRGRSQRRHRQRRSEGILVAVRQERLDQPRVGTRKLQHLLRGAGLAVGRDYLFGLLGAHDLLVAPKRRKVRTTYYDQALPVYRNLLYHYEPTRPHQLWVADITYIDTEEGFLYLSLITDRVSRRIVGWNAGETCEAAESIKALRLALAALPPDCWPIHHSDRGSQYCCHEYVAVLAERGLPVSMTEQNHCYENAHAERVNGILKNEFHLDYKFRTRAHARTAIAQAITTYNTRRPHFSLGLQTPDAVHRHAA
jgi:transposase InsO family protein